MDIIRMSGGIGNQMFQYALYLKLVSLGKKVKFDDVTEYKLDNARPIVLSVFGIDYPRAEKEEVVALTDSAMDLPSRLRRKLSGRKSAEYHEKSVNYDEEVLKKDNTYLCGCFQSERYFKDIEEQVREAFRFRNIEIPEAVKPQIKEYERQIAQSEAVSIHIRRGDYLEAAQVYGGICTDAYYRRAVEYMRERYAQAHFFVFTNDVKWAEEWCKGQQGTFTVIKGTTEETGYIDLMLMSRCRHHIIANSSFSWWGAWLNPSPEKCVIAPVKWLNTCNCHDIFTPDMVRIDAEGNILNGLQENGLKSNNVLLSVIVAVYNIEPYIARCVDSILAQTYENLEIILVDDGSTDASGKICDDYAARDQRIRVIHKQNGGLSDARNAGLEAAGGVYIGFVDGDDWIEPDMYRAMHEACEREHAQVGACRYKQITRSGVIDASTGNSVSLSKNEALEIYVCGDERYLIYNSVWSKLFSAELIRGMRFPVGKNSEDIMFTTKAFCHMERLAYLDTAYYNYVLDREGSIMNEKAGERRLKDEIPFWREQIAYIKASGMEELSEKAAYHFYRRMLFYYIDFMEQKQTRIFAGEIIRQLREDKKCGNIGRVYQNDYVAVGDKVRMKLALALPNLYYHVVKLYDKYVIPLRTGKEMGKV